MFTDWLDGLGHHSKRFIDCILHTDSALIQSTDLVHRKFYTSELFVWALGEIVQWNNSASMGLGIWIIQYSHASSTAKHPTFNESDHFKLIEQSSLCGIPCRVVHLPSIRELRLSNNHWIVGNHIDMSHLDVLYIDKNIDPESQIWIENLLAPCEVYLTYRRNLTLEVNTTKAGTNFKMISKRDTSRSSKPSIWSLHTLTNKLYSARVEVFYTDNIQDVIKETEYIESLCETEESFIQYLELLGEVTFSDGPTNADLWFMMRPFKHYLILWAQGVWQNGMLTFEFNHQTRIR